MASATPVDDEASLVAQLRAGDEAAFELVVRSYGGRLLAVARRIVGSEEDARDVVQDAFMNAFKSLDRFEGNAKLSTWLHRIVVNAALMRLRTRKRKPEQSIESMLPSFMEDGHHEERFQSWDEPVDKLMERAENRELVRKQIDALPEGYRTVLVLRDIEGLDTEETANVLGLSVNATKIRLHRARQALRSLLAPHFRSAVS
ncbi:MAG TPA: sigma-70 family RNA polymerase sigma factor [Vicinamibacterales bacterium]|nr:sigma-70 family RNA polymerase sigma factor [Vicinamibacterales bacterium]